MRWTMPPHGFFLDLNVPKLQYIPILIGEDGNYSFEANAYLVERSCGEWAPGIEPDEDPKIPTLKSRQNIASRLCAFFYWCNANSQLDWREMEYVDDLLGRYQIGLLAGTASVSKRSLAPATINLYLDEACSFLSWAAERGFRSKFKIPRRRFKVANSLGNHSNSHLGINLSVRHGKLGENAFDLSTLPSSSEVFRWLQAVQLRHPVKALIFEFMISTGARISEANELRLSCFPRKAGWRPNWITQGFIPMKLQWGVKGFFPANKVRHAAPGHPVQASAALRP